MVWKILSEVIGFATSVGLRVGVGIKKAGGEAGKTADGAPGLVSVAFAVLVLNGWLDTPSE